MGFPPDRCRASQHGYGWAPDDSNAPKGGITPLHLAAQGDHAGVVTQLLAAGANKEATWTVREAGGSRIGKECAAEHGVSCHHETGSSCVPLQDLTMSV